MKHFLKGLRIRHSSLETSKLFIIIFSLFLSTNGNINILLYLFFIEDRMN